MTWVSEEPVLWDEGMLQMLSDPAHFRVTPCEIVDYSDAPADGPWLPSLAAQPDCEPSYWTKLWAALRGKT